MKIEQLARDNTNFAFDLYRQLAGAAGNLFFSPYSVSTALAMVLAGAQAGTAEQMAAVLNFSLSPEKLHPAFLTLAQQVEAAGTAGSGLLKIANALWPQQGDHFWEEYLDLITVHYGDQIQPLEYANPEAARQIINAWVEAHTESKIKDLIPAGLLHPLVRLVLTNAIYFKGQWAAAFDPGKTQPGLFLRDETQTVETPFMTQEGYFRYASWPAGQLLELPYQKRTLSLLVLLPGEQGLAGLEASLSFETLNAWLRGLEMVKVNLSLPRFKLSAKFELSEALRALGMTEAFDPERANFAGMDGHEHRLYLEAVLHQAFVEVNEVGTEAAAATAVVGRSLGLPEPPVVFRAERPFLFLIRENSTGSLLFVGRLTNPTLEERP